MSSSLTIPVATPYETSVPFAAVLPVVPDSARRALAVTSPRHGSGLPMSGKTRDGVLPRGAPV